MGVTANSFSETKTGLALALVCCTLAIAPGCKRPDIDDSPTGPPTVTVSRPVTKEVTPYALFVGRTEAVNSVDIKARVTGYLQQTPFTEGAEVKAGTVLCKIDPRPYQAQLDASQGELAVNEAKYKLAQTENERAKTLFKQNPKAVSLKSLDQHQAEEEAAAAGVVASKSAMEVYKLNLEFTDVVSPIEGRVGRYQVTIGNLVTENVTTLTTVVSQDPMYVYFNVDEPTMRTSLRRLFEGELPTPASGQVKVGAQMPDETGYPRIGSVNFADNTVDPTTGTITLRAQLDNPANAKGVRMLLPGMFVRVRLPLGRPKPSVLVAEQAIGTDQGQKYVYVVDENNRVQYRAVSLGQLQADGLRVISQGLTADQRVIVSGLQLVRSNVQVKTEEQPMPSAESAAGPSPQKSPSSVRSAPPKEAPSAHPTE